MFSFSMLSVQLLQVPVSFMEVSAGSIPLREQGQASPRSAGVLLQLLIGGCGGEERPLP